MRQGAETQATFTTSHKFGVSGAHRCLPKHLMLWVRGCPASCLCSPEQRPRCCCPRHPPRQAPAPSAAPPSQAWGRGASPTQEVGYQHQRSPRWWCLVQRLPEFPSVYKGHQQQDSNTECSAFTLLGCSYHRSSCEAAGPPQYHKHRQPLRCPQLRSVSNLYTPQPQPVPWI